MDKQTDKQVKEINFGDFGLQFMQEVFSEEILKGQLAQKLPGDVQDILETQTGFPASSYSGHYQLDLQRLLVSKVDASQLKEPDCERAFNIELPVQSTLFLHGNFDGNLTGEARMDIYCRIRLSLTVRAFEPIHLRFIFQLPLSRTNIELVKWEGSEVLRPMIEGTILDSMATMITGMIQEKDRAGELTMNLNSTVRQTLVTRPSKIPPFVKGAKKLSDAQLALPGDVLSGELRPDQADFYSFRLGAGDSMQFTCYAALESDELLKYLWMQDILVTFSVRAKSEKYNLESVNILTKMERRNDEWQRQSLSFTAPEDGLYYLCVEAYYMNSHQAFYKVKVQEVANTGRKICFPEFGVRFVNSVLSPDTLEQKLNETLSQPMPPTGLDLEEIGSVSATPRPGKCKVTRIAAINKNGKTTRPDPSQEILFDVKIPVTLHLVAQGPVEGRDQPAKDKRWEWTVEVMIPVRLRAIALPGAVIYIDYTPVEPNQIEIKKVQGPALLEVLETAANTNLFKGIIAGKINEQLEASRAARTISIPAQLPTSSPPIKKLYDPKAPPMGVPGEFPISPAKKEKSSFNLGPQGMNQFRLQLKESQKVRIRVSATFVPTKENEHMQIAMDAAVSVAIQDLDRATYRDGYESVNFTRRSMKLKLDFVAPESNTYLLRLRNESHSYTYKFDLEVS